MATAATILQSETRKSKRVMPLLFAPRWRKKSLPGQNHSARPKYRIGVKQTKAFNGSNPQVLSRVQLLILQKNIKHVKQALRGIVETKEIDRWLSAPNTLLDGSRPVDSIKQGRTKQVLEIVALVQEGIHV